MQRRNQLASLRRIPVRVIRGVVSVPAVRADLLTHRVEYFDDLSGKWIEHDSGNHGRQSADAGRS
jgi:hypothetical protein